ncbi:2-isopropylmalate synthase [Actinomadura rupiterrae]|nr:2-isopropylmalate synthase [Actinomadura rupiterrae]
MAEPMDPGRKRRFFDLLVAMGYKEIEVGYPSASETDFAFVRHLVEDGVVPDDVTPVVFTPARKDLIERTVASIQGMPRAVVHLYTATAPTWRNVVLGRDRDELRALILDAAGFLAGLVGDGVRLQFSPETFNLTEIDYALEICDAVSACWDASPDRPVTLNLPATVEIATPNVYADQIEYMHLNLARRDAVILSVHPHNDRGTGVACAELAMLAGAQRVEGCLFGNGERTGNVDLVTLGLNLHAQGIDPMIDFSDIDGIRRTVEYCNRIGVHERHPYAGDLVYTAFSGTHQDAIKKGFEHRARGGDPDRWDVPYLPIDPKDVGRDYEAVIRVNSQSGKGGVAYLLKADHGLDLPRPMQAEFSRIVQRHTDGTGEEATSKELWELFRATYFARYEDGPIRLADWRTGSTGPGFHTFTCVIDGTEHTGTGLGPLDALAAALTKAGVGLDVLHYVEHAVEPGQGAHAVAYAQVKVGDVVCWGAGRDTSVLTASVQAVLSGANRCLTI